jgi:hypothetical protein
MLCTLQSKFEHWPAGQECTATDAFYTQYTNAYDGDYTQGVAILASDDVPPRALLTPRDQPSPLSQHSLNTACCMWR